MSGLADRLAKLSGDISSGLSLRAFRKEETKATDESSSEQVSEDVVNALHPESKDENVERLEDIKKPLLEGEENSRKRYKKFKLWNCWFVFMMSVGITMLTFVIAYSIFRDIEPVYSQKKWRVVLFGDSLWHIPFNSYFLNERLHILLPGYDIHFIDAGKNGDEIADMRARVYPDVLNLNPDIVMLFWDSDVSNNDIDYLENPDTQQAYYENVYYVVDLIRKNVSFCAVAGPNLLGEGGPIFEIKQMQGKDGMLNRYREINMNVSAQLNVTYVNIRSRFQNSIPTWWPLARWWLTIDGEHPYAHGANLEAQLFANTLRSFFKAFNDSAPIPSELYPVADDDLTG